MYVPSPRIVLATKTYGSGIQYRCLFHFIRVYAVLLFDGNGAFTFLRRHRRGDAGIGGAGITSLILQRKQVELSESETHHLLFVPDTNGEVFERGQSST